MRIRLPFPPPAMAALHAGDWLALAAVIAAHAGAAGLLVRHSSAPTVYQPPRVLEVAWHDSTAPHPTPASTPKPPPAVQRPALRPKPGAAAAKAISATPAPPPLLSAPAITAAESLPDEPRSASTQTAGAAASVQAVGHDAPPRAARSEAPEMTAPIFRADYLANPAPPYPRLSRELREQGRVLLRVHVATDGQATEVLLHQSSGFERLDAAALQAVHQWKFVPARRGAEVVAAWVIVPIEFSLRSHLS